jgi:hypothetical protein
MDVYGRSLFRAEVIKAHEEPYICIEMDVLILATNLTEAEWILLNKVRGWKRHRDYLVYDENFNTYHSLPNDKKRKLDRVGYITLN